MQWNPSEPGEIAGAGVGVSRRRLLQWGAGAGVIVGASAANLSLPWPAYAAPRRADGVPPAEALQRLVDGNARYAREVVQGPNRSAARRVAVAPKQYPFASILSCADSRVPPEVIFDQGIGDLFVVRVAGNILDDVVQASLEYSVEVLGVQLVMVLGHSACGAVAAAIDMVEKGAVLPGALPALGDAIAPAVKSVSGMPGDPVANAVNANVTLNVARCASEKVLYGPRVSNGSVMVVGGVYDLASGEVKLQGKM